MTFNHDAERACISAALRDNKTLLDLCVSLRREHFHLPLHRNIWGAIELSSNLAKIGASIDSVTLTKWVTDTEPGLSSKELIDRVVEAAPTDGDPASWATIVFDWWRVRELVRGRELTRNELAAAAKDCGGFIRAELSRVANLSSMDPKPRSNGMINTHLVASWNDFQERAKAHGVIGIPTGVGEMDEAFHGWRPGRLYYVGARPGTGKTAFLVQASVEAITAKRALYRVSQRPQSATTDAIAHSLRAQAEHTWAAVFSLEMLGPRVMDRIVSHVARIDSKLIEQARMSPPQLSEYTAAMERVSKFTRLRMWDSTDRARGSAKFSLPLMRSLIEDTKARMESGGVDRGVVFVDYVTKIDPASPERYRDPRTTIGAVSAGLADIAKDLNVAVVCLAQIRRPSGDDHPEPPTEASLKETGNLEEDADGVVLLHRTHPYSADDPPERQRETLIRLRKMRDGGNRDITVSFRGEFSSFEDVEL